MKIIGFEYSVPESQFGPPTKPKKLDGRKARRKHYKIIEEAPRAAKGRFRKGEGWRRGAMSKRGVVAQGDRVFDQGPLVDPHKDPYLKS